MEAFLTTDFGAIHFVKVLRPSDTPGKWVVQNHNTEARVEEAGGWQLECALTGLPWPQALAKREEVPMQ